MKKLFILILAIFATNYSFSQGDISSPVPNIELYSPSTNSYNPLNIYTIPLGCGTDEATVRGSYTEVGSTDSYRVERIQYRPKPYARDSNFDGVIDNNDFTLNYSSNAVGAVETTLQDDYWSNEYRLRTNDADLNFCFFGNSRNHFRVSANGAVTFNTVGNYPVAPAYPLYQGGIVNESAWQGHTFLKIQPDANMNSAARPNENRETILVCFTDTYPTHTDRLSDSYSFWQVLGNINERYFTLGFHHLPMYGCGNQNGYATYQMVFYETTNIIEYHIKEKPICTSWPGGEFAAMGIQNKDLDLGIAIPGRDNLDHYQILDLTDGFYDGNFDSNFPVLPSESWRFIPNGNLSATPVFTWYENYNHGTQTGIPFGADPHDIHLTVTAQDLIDANITSVTYTAEVAYTDPCDGTILKFTRDITFKLDDPLLMHIKELNSVDDTIEVYDIENLTLCVGDDYTLEALVQHYNVADGSTLTYQWQMKEFPNPFVILPSTTNTTQITNAQPGTYTYVVTVSHLDDQGVLICQFDDSINVTVTDTVSFEYPGATNTYCASDADPTPINIRPLGGTYTINNGGVWANPEANPLESLNGTIDLSESMNTATGGNANGTGVFTITYTAGTCASNTAQEIVTIIDAPNIRVPINNLIECEINTLHQGVFDMAAIELELLNGETGLTLLWENNVGGGPAPPNPMTASFTTENITLKVTATDPANPTCTSEVVFSLTVNTAPAIINQNENSCSGVALNINLDSYTTLVGNSYSWSAADNPNVTGETIATTTNRLITDLLTNTSNSSQNVIYTVTPTGSNGCAGIPFTVIVEVAPALTINNQTDSTCSGSAINVDLNSYTAQAGVTYSWIATDNLNVTGETTTATTTANITDTLTNTSTTTQDVVYTVTPSVNGCPGTDFTVTVSVGNPSFDFAQASYCSDDLDPIPTNVFPAVGTAEAGVFTISNGGVWVNPQANPLESLDGIIDLSESMNTVVGGNTDGSGNFRVTYTTTVGTAPNQSFCTAFFDISISTVETNFTYANSYCISGANPLPTSIGSAGGTFAILPSGTVLDTTTGEIDIATLVVGTTYTVTYSKAGSCPSSTSITFDVTAAADATFTYPAVICLSNAASLLPNSITTGGGSFGITLTDGSAGGTINATTGDLAGNAAGTYKVKYTTTGCVGSSEIDITINPIENAVFSFTNAAYCAGDGNITPTLDANISTGIFTIGSVTLPPTSLPINATTGEITVDAAATTSITYDIIYTTTGPCSTSSTQQVTINPEDNAAFSYPSATVCIANNTTTPNSISTNGGTFTILKSDSTAGGSINAATGEVDLTASTVGSYIITYDTTSVGNACPNSTTFALTITAQDETDFGYNGTNSTQTDFCVSDGSAMPNPAPNTSGGTYTINNGGTINALTGEIDFGAGATVATNTPYTIQYTTAGSCFNTSTTTIVLHSDETATFNYDLFYCSDGANPTPTVTGTGGGLFEITNGGVFVDSGTSTNSTSGEFDLVALSALTTAGLGADGTGVFKITYKTQGTFCPDSAEYTITINPTPEITTPVSETVCGSFTFKTISGTHLTGNEGYYTGPLGTGTAYSAGDVINYDGTATYPLIFYAYDATTTNPICSKEKSFTVTINISPVITALGSQTHCDSYILPVIAGINLVTPKYYTEANGGGTAYNAGTTLNYIDFATYPKTLYIYDETGTNPNCSDEKSFELTLNATPDITPFITPVQVHCDRYPLPTINGTNLVSPKYYTQTGGGGSAYDPGTVLEYADFPSASYPVTLYMYSQTGTTPNCSDEESFTLTIHQKPDIDTPTNSAIEVCNSYTLPVITGTNLTGNESYYDQPNGPDGTGNVYAAGFTFNETTPVTYPITLYIYDATGTAATTLCDDEETFTLNVIPEPVYTMPTDITQCEDPDPNIHTSGFDTTTWNSTILGAQVNPKYSVIYTAVTIDPNTGVETAYTLPDPLPATLNAPSITIRATVRYTIDAATSTWCESVPAAVNDNSFRLIVREIPVAVIPTDSGYTAGNETLNACEDDNNIDPNVHTAEFDTSNWRNIIFDIPVNTDNPNYEIEYTYHDGVANVTTTNIPNPLVVASQPISFVVRNISTGAGIPACDSQVHQFKLQVNILPVGTSITPEICSGEEVHVFDANSNSIALDLDNFTTFIDEGDGINRNTYKWHAVANPDVNGETTTEVVTNTTDTTITDVLTNSSATAQFVVYEVTPISVNGCKGAMFTITVEVGFAPDITDQNEDACNEDQLSIDLDSYTTLTGNTYKWKAKMDYVDIEGETLTEQTSTIISDTLTNNSSSSIFVEYEVIPTSAAQCEGNAFTVTVEVHPKPQFTLKDQYFICPDAQTDTTIGEVTNPSGYSYQWFVATDMTAPINNNNPDDRLLDLNQADITMSGGIYALTATDINGCSHTLLTSVSMAEQFEITNVYVDDFNGPDNTITIEVTGGSGMFEYTLTDENNNSVTQVGNPVFHNVVASTYQIEVTDATGCSKFKIQDDIHVLDYPPFFTPNGDLNNDTWQIKGADLIPNSKIYIYDRYGKLLAQVDPKSVVGWDGLYNGKQMPASDYWFTANYIDPNNAQPKIVKGHFSIIRR